MRKRRTRKQKERARYNYLVQRFSKKSKTASKLKKRETNVKRQIELPEAKVFNELIKKEEAVDKAIIYKSASVKQNITKSFVHAGIILCLELMLYLYLKF